MAKKKIEKVEAALASIPQKAQAAVAAHGVRVVAPVRVVDHFPWLKGVRPRGWADGLTWANADGLFQEELRQVPYASLP